MKEIILNKKKSIINSVIIPIIFCLLYILVYNFIPGIKVYIDENLGKQFLKGTFIFAAVITLVLSMITFWGNEFFSEIRYKKNQMVLDKKKTELISMIIPFVIGAFLILFITFLPLGINDNLFISHLKISIIIAILVSVLSSIIIFWIIVLFSKEGKNNEK